MKKTSLLFAAFVLCALGVVAQTTETPPPGWINLYSLTYNSLTHTQVDMGGTVNGNDERLLVGPGDGWGSGSHYYDVSKYDSLAIKVSFVPENAGKQGAFRIAWNKAGNNDVVLYTFTYPSDGSTYMIFGVSLANRTSLDGLNFYNGKTHWSFSYSGTPATNPVTIDYIALKVVVPTALGIQAEDEVTAKALPYGLTTILKPVFTPARATYNAVTWESLNPDIATVDAHGVVTAGTTTAGIATIKATSETYPELSATYDVVVVAAVTPVSGVEINKDSASVKMLNTLTLTANVLPTNATNRTISWTSTDETVATVDATGKVTPIKAGTTHVVVTTEDGAYKDTCVVTVVGFRKIPAGYVSLYTLSYNMEGTLNPLAGNTNGLGANLPAIATSNGYSLLGPGADWNRANKYVDLMGYSEVQVACTFNPADIGKKMQFRYAFSKASGDGVDGSVITNRTFTITDTDMYLTIDLDNDTADVDKLKRIGAIKFRSDVDGEIRFNVDYVAIKIAQPSSITLSKNALELEIGQQDTLTYTLLPADAVNKTVVWTSSDTTKVKVTNGALEAVGMGQAIIKLMAAADTTVLDSCVVTVNPFPAGWVSLYSLTYQNNTQIDMTGTVNGGADKLLVGPANGWGTGDQFYDVSRYDSLAIKISFDPENVGKQGAFRIAWNKAGNNGVVLYTFTYPSDGSTYMIFGVSLADKTSLDGMSFYNGATHWSFSYEGTAATHPVTIDYVALRTVPATGLSVEATDEVTAKALPLGLTTTLKPVFTPANATYHAVTWESLNPDIATVDAHGVVTASMTTAGTATIKAASVTYGFTATYEVVVVAAVTPVSGVEINKDSASVKMLNTLTLTANVLPANATNRTISWTSTDETVATVDATGKVTPIKAGTTHVVVTTEDGAYKDTCVVTVVGFREIPAGYVSLYTLSYNMEGTLNPLAGNTNGLGANLPAIATSNGYSLLGPGADWNRANKYVDLMGYSEVQVACTFTPADIGKKMQFRYAFSKASGDGVDGSVITNRTFTITDTDMYLTIDLGYDTADVDKLRRVGAIKFRSDVDGEIRFNIDYVAVKVINTTGINLVESSVNMNPGETKQLAVNMVPAGASMLPITWSTSDPSVVTVTNGLVTAVAEGFATIKATAQLDTLQFADSVTVHVVDLPEAYTYLYDLSYSSATHIQYDMTGVIDGATSNQLVGPLAGWGDGVHFYDVTEFDTLAIKISFDPADAGKQAAIRMGNSTVISFFMFTYPTDGSTSFEYKIVLTGKSQLDGLVYYNGATHWSFIYDGTPATQPVTIQYLAVRKSNDVGLDNVREAEDPNALVNVYNIAGMLIRRNVKASEATVGLKEGLYLVGNRKVMVVR